MVVDVERYRQIYFEETSDHLANVEAGLLYLEKSPGDGQVLDEVFRGIHTIKGGAATFQYDDIARFSHSMETYLDAIRTDHKLASGSDIEMLLRSLDCLQSLVAAARDDRPLPETLAALQEELDHAHSRLGIPRSAPNEATDDASTESAFEVPTEQAEQDFGSAVPDTRFFGGWLVERNVVTAEQVVQALDRQRLDHVVIGQVALQSRKMSVRQVFETLRWMCTTGERFGETAVALGHLSNGDVAELLDQQLKSRRPIGEILLEMGAVNRETLEREVAGFHAAGGHSAEILIKPSPEMAASNQVDATQSAVDLSKLRLNRELIPDFLIDFQEHLDAAERCALLLERDPSVEEALHALYRGFHTMKGVSSFFGLTEITQLAHSAEGVLNAARDGTIRLAGRAFELTLESLDALSRLAQRVPAYADAQSPPAADPVIAALVSSLKAVVTDFTGPDTALPIQVSTAESCGQPSTSTESAVSADHVQPCRNEAKETVRVDRDRLDKLVDTIGELVIGEAMVRQEAAAHCTLDTMESIEQLGRTVRELQEMSLSLRMVPIAGTFQKMNRIIRDVARKLGKKVNFVSEGEDTELDKTMVDQLGDPLMHMVRNSIDHGIESPEQRLKAGKPAEGQVTLRAFLRSGNFYIELEDDGSGLNRQAILKKAVESGVVDPAQADSMPDKDVWKLIFAPGFSTAAAVTDVSGRGVGMDVVQRNVQSLNGCVEIESIHGQGSTFRIRLPLTMAIVDGLSISLDEEVFIIPLVSVVESLRPLPSDTKMIGGRGELLMVRGEVIPLVRLNRVFNRPALVTQPSDGLVVIVEAQGQQMALLVDKLMGQVQAVMKSLDANYRKVPGISGATILGTGDVAFILDIPGIARLKDGLDLFQ